MLQTERQLDCALDLMRRLPPQQIEKNLSDVIDLVSDLTLSYGGSGSVITLQIAEVMYARVLSFGIY